MSLPSNLHATATWPCFLLQMIFVYMKDTGQLEQHRGLSCSHVQFDTVVAQLSQGVCCKSPANAGPDDGDFWTVAVMLDLGAFAAQAVVPEDRKRLQQSRGHEHR